MSSVLDAAPNAARLRTNTRRMDVRIAASRWKNCGETMTDRLDQMQEYEDRGESPPFQGGVARSAGAVGKVAKRPYRYSRSAPTQPPRRLAPPLLGKERN